MNQPSVAPINTSLVKNPKWTGADSEFAIEVTRGYPRRSDLQMEQAVAKQMRDYVLHYTSLRPSDLAFALAVQRIAKDHIAPVDSAGVLIQRKDLVSCVQAAVKAVGELEGGDAQG